MDRLKDILLPKRFQQPPEVKRLKAYIQTNFKADPAITAGPKQIIISAKSAALAGTLRLHSHQMAKICQVDKRLIIRIS